MTCDVVACGAAEARLEELPALRRRLQGDGAAALSATTLKHADEQTVVGLAAVFQALDNSGLDRSLFGDWGVVAAPRFPGRVATALAFEKFLVEGAWGISPHLIPNRSQHSLSGAISQALSLHGPNFGAGGGPGGETEALLAAAAMLDLGSLPGVWVVCTGWDPEVVAHPKDGQLCGSVCRAVALALSPSRPGWRGIRLRLTLGDESSTRCKLVDGPADSSLRLESLAAALGPGTLPTIKCGWTLDCGGRVELDRTTAAGENER